MNNGLGQMMQLFNSQYDVDLCDLVAVAVQLIKFLDNSALCFLCDSNMLHSYSSSFFTLSMYFPRSYVALWGYYDIICSTYGLYLWFPILEDHISLSNRG